MYSNIVKISLFMPREVLDLIDKLVGKRNRNKFIREATIKELKRIRLQKALEMAAGAWKDEDYPELKKGVDKWVRKLREG
ncbi:MAG: hypothetical protein M1371_09585 [Actinobacteria bacterium]|nr:hypothetical protein [Actinomycetota bacterium]